MSESAADECLICKRVLHTEDDCALLARDLASIYRASMRHKPSSWRVYLQGDLGLGKTSFVRHLLRALGVDERIKSPSFALMYSYPLGFDLNEPFDSAISLERPEECAAQKPGAPGIEAYHFDFYRLNSPDDWLGVGLEACFDDPTALLLVEWPEKASLPAWDLQLRWTWAAQEDPNAAGAKPDPEATPAQGPRVLSLRVRHDFSARAALTQGLHAEAQNFSAPAG